MTISKASTTWKGDLMKGSGEVSAASGVFRDAPVSWARRAEDRSSGTSPEELIAAAHASCFSMALAAQLGRNDTPPTSLEVSAAVTFDKADGGFRIVSSALEVVGEVPGIDEATFKKIADGAKDGCPVSQALKGNVKLSVSARLA